MKDNVLEMKINTKKIDRMIDQYECVKGVPPSYIVMNKETIFLLVADCYPILVTDTQYGVVYKGIAVATCEKLKNGEVEVV